VAAYADEEEIVPGRAGWLLNDVGLYLAERAEYGAARDCLERAVKLVEAAYGPEHEKVATAINNLGNVLRELGDLAGARANFERALRIRRKFLGEDHSATRNSKRWLEIVEEEIETSMKDEG
jgi:Tfp pilus assembly protein PilF